MGGIWERMVRSVRRALLSLTEELTMTEDQLRTFLFEVEAIVNSRPLTSITLEMNSELPLIPNHFLRPNAVAGLPPIITSTKDDQPLQGWRYVQTAADHFWRRFSKEYLRTIHPRQKWHDTKNNLEVDDIVLAVDNNCPRSEWPLGRIVETYPDEHGVVRSVLVRINVHDVRCPIHKLCLIQPAREIYPSDLEPGQMTSEDLSSTLVEEPRATACEESCTNVCEDSCTNASEGSCTNAREETSANVCEESCTNERGEPCTSVSKDMIVYD